MHPRLAITLCTIGIGLFVFGPAYSACDLIPGTYPLSSGAGLDIDKDVTINGNSVAEGETGANSVLDTDGSRSTVSQSLPDLDPASFPVNSSSTNASDADSPFTSSTDVYYQKITVNEQKTATFSGGGPFHIDELELKEEAVLNLDSGTYYIDTLKMEDKEARINVTNEPVILHIGSEFKLSGKELVINSGGAITDFRVFLHDGAEFKNEGKELDFTGLIYGPNSGEIEIAKDANFHGAIITSAKVKIAKDVTLTYTASDQAAVSAISTCAGSSPVTPFGFNCVESGLDALTGKLYTKTVGQSFSFDMVALKDSDNDGAADAVETDYASEADRTVSVELIDTSSAAACLAYPVLSPAVSQSVVFTASDAGRKASGAMSTNVAYRSVGCRVTDNTDIANPVVGCSTDSFAARPTAITVSSNMTNSGAIGAPTANAGANFTLTATASVGYDGTPSLDSGKLEAHAGASQIGVVSGVFGAADSATGIATGSGFTYTEVGNIRYLAEGVYDDSFTAIDQVGGDCTDDFSNALVGGKVGCKFGNTSATNYFGRFIPDHFTFSGEFITNRIDRACAALSNFTYMDEYFQAAFSLSAENLAGNTTQNYTDSYAKLDPSVPSNFDFTALDLGVTVTDLTGRLNIRSSTGAWSNGIAGSIAADLAVTRLTSPDGAYASLNVGINPIDSDGVTLDAFDLDEDQNSVDDHAAVGQTQARFGRLNIANAHGSELLTLPVPLTAQYYSGSGIGFVTNADDSCTAIAIADLILSNDVEAGQTDGDINIQSSPNIATQASLVNTILSAGDAGLTLCQPGNPACTPAAGNTGYVDIEVTTPSYLQFDWFGTGPTDPQSRASFGLFKGRRSQIYMREVY